MANASLRDRARAAENRDNWRDAVTLYRQLLEESAGEEVDIALWNRVGDLHLRLNETERAVDAYERAVAAYADSGLYNNAIALCRKILRLVPGRAAVYHQLGRISAAAGFLADARQNFLEYADRMRRAGKLDASFEALKEFADLSPDDVQVRRMLADQLLAHGQKDPAIEQLRILMGTHTQRGEEVAAMQVQEQIHAIDPTADDTPLMRSRAAAMDDFSAALHSGDEVVEELPRTRRVEDDEDRGMLDLGGTIEPVDVQMGSAIEDTLPGLERTSMDEVSPMEGLESTSLDQPPRRTSLPPLEHAPLDLELEDAEPLPMLEEGEGEPLPLLDLGTPGTATPAPAAPPGMSDQRLGELREHLAAVPEDSHSREELIRELRARGLGHEVQEVLENAHRALAAKGMYLEAVAPITALIGLRPDDGILLQKRVEYAFRSGNADAQIEAYLDLGRHLAKNGQEGKAGAVFKRVLELDPHNVEARALVGQLSPAARPDATPAARPAAPAAPPGVEYVDLGALILDEEGGREPTTRFVVEEREPSGDEDKDFAEMLAHFRQKVAENIEVEDSSSHYDLGVAFMEMGLVDEAIAEFQVALRGGANPLATLELLGQCFLDKSQYAVASRVLDRALRLTGVTDGDLVGVLYLLGRIEEDTGNTERALEFYERVVSVDIRFRDTAKRLERLKGAVR